MKIFKNILNFLGITDTTAKVELSEEQKESIDTALGELEALKTERDGLKTEVDALKVATGQNSAKITEQEETIATMTTAKTAADADVVRLTAEVERLGKLDAGSFSNTSGQQEKEETEDVIEYSQSQKELLEKVKNS